MEVVSANQRDKQCLYNGFVALTIMAQMLVIHVDTCTNQETSLLSLTAVMWESRIMVRDASATY